MVDRIANLFSDREQISLQQLKQANHCKVDLMRRVTVILDYNASQDNNPQRAWCCNAVHSPMMPAADCTSCKTMLIPTANYLALDKAVNQM